MYVYNISSIQYTATYVVYLHIFYLLDVVVVAEISVYIRIRRLFSTAVTAGPRTTVARCADSTEVIGSLTDSEWKD
jgi:hypothetical protein